MDKTDPFILKTSIDRKTDIIIYSFLTRLYGSRRSGIQPGFGRAGKDRCQVIPAIFSGVLFSTSPGGVP